jgi:hypothetical protein
MRKDGAKFDLVVTMMISAPWLGGPTADVRFVGGSNSDAYNVEILSYRNGDTIRLSYKEDDRQNKILLQPPQSAVIISPSAIKKAEKLVNDTLKAYLKANKYVYFGANGPCRFNDDENLFTDEFNLVLPLK